LAQDQIDSGACEPKGHIPAREEAPPERQDPSQAQDATWSAWRCNPACPTLQQDASVQAEREGQFAITVGDGLLSSLPGEPREIQGAVLLSLAGKMAPRRLSGRA
jgi:hypothetical protein